MRTIPSVISVSTSGKSNKSSVDRELERNRLAEGFTRRYRQYCLALLSVLLPFVTTSAQCVSRPRLEFAYGSLEGALIPEYKPFKNIDKLSLWVKTVDKKTTFSVVADPDDPSYGINVKSGTFHLGHIPLRNNLIVIAKAQLKDGSTFTGAANVPSNHGAECQRLEEVPPSPNLQVSPKSPQDVPLQQHSLMQQQRVMIELVSIPVIPKSSKYDSPQSPESSVEVTISLEGAGKALTNAAVLFQSAEQLDGEFAKAEGKNTSRTIPVQPGHTYYIEVIAENFEPALYILTALAKEKEVIATPTSAESDTHCDGVHPHKDPCRARVQLGKAKISLRPEPNRMPGPSAGESVSRSSDFPAEYAEILPLPGWRSPDTLALLLPGVTDRPVAVGAQVPGVAPGIGTAGQFSINGMRGRDNSFMNDGSDNNDEDIGVRRQGLISAFPQPIESLSEFRVVTASANATYSRAIGGFLDGRSRSGTNHFHGSLWGFATEKH